MMNMNKYQKYFNDLQNLIVQRTDSQQHLFRRMYQDNEVNLEIPITDVILNMDIEKHGIALQQVKRTVEKHKLGSS